MASIASKLWVGAKGAAKYAAAVATGDIADEVVAAARFEGWCMSCPSVKHRRARLQDQGVEVYYCGPELEEHFDSVMPTCGCLVGLTVGGQAQPGGKTVVRSQMCPQRRW